MVKATTRTYETGLRKRFLFLLKEIEEPLHEKIHNLVVSQCEKENLKSVCFSTGIAFKILLSKFFLSTLQKSKKHFGWISVCSTSFAKTIKLYEKIISKSMKDARICACLS